MADWRSRARWTSDVFLQRLPLSLQGPRREARRTIRLRDGIRLRYRLNRGDLQGIREVWIDDCYRFPIDLGTVGTIVDLGANIGLTSVYLARRYQARRLVAVEPVASNAALVRENLALNDIPGHVIEAVVGPAGGIAYFRDAVNSNVGHLVSDDLAGDDAREVISLDMQAVFGHLGAEKVDLLKVDIEGAEHDLLSGDLAWLVQVRALMIEFHTGMVDYRRLITVLESEGFRYIPPDSMYANSAAGFIRERAA